MDGEKIKMDTSEETIQDTVIVQDALKAFGYIDPWDEEAHNAAYGLMVKCDDMDELVSIIPKDDMLKKFIASRLPPSRYYFVDMYH